MVQMRGNFPRLKKARELVGIIESGVVLPQLTNLLVHAFLDAYQVRHKHSVQFPPEPARKPPNESL